jgi:hypothetical protein
MVEPIGNAAAERQRDAAESDDPFDTHSSSLPAG